MVVDDVFEGFFGNGYVEEFPFALVFEDSVVDVVQSRMSRISFLMIRAVCAVVVDVRILSPRPSIISALGTRSSFTCKVSVVQA